MFINKYYDSVIFGTLLMGLSYATAYVAGWVNLHEVNWLEVFAVWTSYICTLLCVFQSRWNYPIGVITTALYSYLFFIWNLPAVAIFNLYLVGSLCYGWFRWGTDAHGRPVTRVKGFWWLGYVGIGVAVYGLLYLINAMFGYEMKQLDIAVAVLSGVAQFLLDNKKIESWGFWVVVNVLSIYLYFTQGLYLVTLQYVFFLGNAFWGYYMWNKPKEIVDAI